MDEDESTLRDAETFLDEYGTWGDPREALEWAEYFLERLPALSTQKATRDPLTEQREATALGRLGDAVGDLKDVLEAMERHPLGDPFCPWICPW